MAICKDCVFWLKCLGCISYIMDYDEITGKEITDIEKRCINFKDKSQYVEVVRCKTCKHRDKSGLCQAEGQKLTIAKDNHFCSKGKRRPENENT